MVCKYCGGSISKRASVCPNCGSPLGNEDAIPSNGYSGDREKQVDLYLLDNGKKLPIGKVDEIREEFLSLDDRQWSSIRSVELKDTTVMLLISIFLGGWGIDRFMLGDNKNGGYKLGSALLGYALSWIGVGFVLLIGNCIWWVYDLIKINEMTTNYNYKLLKERLNMI